MLEFIKRNKIFSSCLLICSLIILLLISLILIKDITGNDDVIVIPPIVEEEQKEPEIHLFTGDFEDETDSIHLTWDYQINNHTFQKVEIYKIDEDSDDETFIKTLYSERSYDVSIYEYGISTGENTFELRLYYDNGIVINKEIEVFVDYVFNADIHYQLVDNNLGKGYLITFSYNYNTVTPVGPPINDSTKITTESSTSVYWNWKTITWVSSELENSSQSKNVYQNTKVYYFIHLDSFSNEDITWNLDIRLDSVGVRYEDSFTDNPSLTIPSTTDIEIK